ncbi:MAG: glutamine--fructose-6-phosphate transaminase (isomerizing) [Nitrospinota bacterium]|nr:glutamine--fructose-6-phosphate transaminase (isomerizing) [Nitrospinota bacterium]
MCGITGAVGLKDIANVLFEGIRNLEYRGYDSCGVALMNRNSIIVKKNVGGVGDVYQKENILRHSTHLGIAHTRWATHGQVTRNNTHPFLSCDKNFAVIHNGIISNYQELKVRLQKEGHRFQSETDTEVIPHLLEKFYAKTGDLEASLIQTVKLLEGTFAIAFITSHQPDQIYCAKRESPLLLGIGDEVKFIGSDFNAFIDHTKNAVIIDDDEYAIVSKDGYIVKNLLTREEINKPITRMEWDSETSKKGGYPHYMLKEIYEQPQTVVNALEVEEKTVDRLVNMIHKSKSAHLVGVGTTYYVTLYGTYIFSALAGRYIPAISSDEFASLSPVDKDSFVLAASQSGETYDTISAIKYAQSRGAKTGAIVNVMGSTLSRLVDCPVLQGSGPEICVISTKAALAQMILLTRTALKLGLKNKKIARKTYDGFMKSLRSLPDIIEGILNERSGFIHRVAHNHRNVKNWLYLGRGVYYPIALESALKMKEVAYVHAEGMPCGFLKHGTLAMIDSDINSIVFIPPNSEKVLYESTLASVEEIRARNGFVLGIHFDEGNRNQGLFSEELILPPVPPVIAPLIQMVIAQLFAYFTATSLKRNVDKPRSLAKSVTVG